MQVTVSQPARKICAATKPLRIAVFGGNGPTGRLITSQALHDGHTVSAFTRHPEAFPLRHENLKVVHGDVFDAESVEDVVAGQDAVLSSLGVPTAAS